MYVKEVLVQNKAGLHARPATFFIQKANEFKSTIWVEKEERRVNAKSTSRCAFAWHYRRHNNKDYCRRFG